MSRLSTWKYGSRSSFRSNNTYKINIQKFFLQIDDRGFEAVGHLVEVSRAVGGEVSDNPTVPDHGEEWFGVGGKGVVLHELQQLKTLSISIKYI